MHHADGRGVAVYQLCPLRVERRAVGPALPMARQRPDAPRPHEPPCVRAARGAGRPARRGQVGKRRQSRPRGRMGKDVGRHRHTMSHITIKSSLLLVTWAGMIPGCTLEALNN